MKTINVIFIRHAEANGPEKTVLQDELNRAHDAGKQLRSSTPLDAIDAVSHTALVRTAQTAVAVAHGFQVGHEPSAFCLAEAIPELGSQSITSMILAHPDMDQRSKEIGNFAALLELFGEAKAKTMAKIFMKGIERVIFSQAMEGENWLVCAHSPVIELLIWHFYHHNLSEMPERFKNLNTLDAVHVELNYRDDGYFAEVLEKVDAPPRQAVAQQ